MAKAALLAAAAVLIVSCGGGSGAGPTAPAVASVVVSPGNATVDVGSTVKLTAQAYDATGTALVRSFTWASSDSSRAKVDSNGVVTGVAAGSVSITASTDSVTSAPATLSVTIAAGSQSSFDRIDAALANGSISEETAITYKVFATFGDTRLPVEFRGNDSAVVESDVFDLLNDRWETLSNTTKETLEPFLVPPAYQGSWNSLASAGPQVLRTAPGGRATTLGVRSGTDARPQSLSLPICAQPTIDPNWAAKPATQDGHFKVWYDTRVAGMAARADLALAELEGKIWPTIVNTAGMKAPLSDGTYTNCNGGDGRLDVYLTGGLTVSGGTAADLGDTWPIRTWATDNLPVFLLIKPTLDDNELRGTLAHEFTHASQWAYNVAALRNASYKWLKESTAQAMIDVVYPTLPRGTTEFPGCTTAQFEQCVAKRYTDTPDSSLEDATLGAWRTYGSYLFFQFLARTNSPSVIAQVWNMTQSESNQVLAVDKGIPGGFKEQWPKFAKLLWNQDPVNTQSFDGWDSLTLTPALRGGSVVPIRLGGAPGVKLPLNGNIKHLASHYYQFSISDPNIRSLSFFNHMYAFLPTGSPIVSTQAFIKKEGSIWQYEHWSDQTIDVDGVKSYCLDLVAERVTDLVIVMSNVDPTQDIDMGSLPFPLVSASNVGCWRYKGSASVSISGSSPQQTSFRSSVDGSVTFERYRPPQLPNGAPGQETFQVLSGAITANLNQTDPAGCTLTQQASGDMTPGLQSGSLTVQLGLDIGNGVAPRDVSGSGSATALTHSTLTCPKVDPINTDATNSWSWLDLPGPDEMAVVVKPDGTITGSFTRTLSPPASGTAVLTWNLTPMRQ